jgi:polysaccharide export outer membrane protein
MIPNRRTSSGLFLGLGVALLSGVMGCSTNPKALATGGQITNPPATRAENIERLAELHAKRTAEGDERDYVVGSGDVLGIRAFDFADLNGRVRVDGEGNVMLPLLDTVSVKGLTVSEVEKALTKRLGEYMYQPYVTVFVEEYRSQQVVVVGAVEKPGLVTLVDRNSTVLDAIAAAGGMTGGAAGRIYLIPGEQRGAVDAEMLANVLKGGAGAEAVLDKPNAEVRPLMLDSKEAPQGIESFFYSLPVRGSDVIVVGAAGNFILQGWVHKPGTYPVQPGLTLRGALATGGGLRFAANRNRVRVHRLTADAKIDTETLSYSDIVEERIPDVFIHEGDVIEVASSKAKLVPYAFYELVTDLIKVGAGLRVTP